MHICLKQKNSLVKTLGMHEVVSSERELSDGEFSAKEKKSYGEFKGEALSCSCKNK